MNKAEEWVLLKAAFLPAEIHGAVESESPDFLVPRDELDLGIEVTEAFMSESQARMELIPDYLGEVLHDRRYRHRSDKKAYPIKRVRWTAKDGSLVDLEGIVYLNPNTEQQTSRLESAIISKASRVSSYRSRCSTVELIVHDRGIFSERVQKSEIARIFHNKSLRNAIQRSGFREIRYLVRAKEGGLFCYPVRIGFLAEELLLFFGALAEVKCTESTARVGAALSCHLTNAGFQSVSVFCGDSKKVSVVSDVAAAVYDRELFQNSIYDLHSEEGLRLVQQHTNQRVESEGEAVLSSVKSVLENASCHFDFARPTSLS